MSTSNPARIPSKKLVVFNVLGVSSKFIVSSLGRFFTVPPCLVLLVSLVVEKHEKKQQKG